MNDFLNIGFGSYVNIGKIRLITQVDPERLRRELKKRQIEKSSPHFWDASGGKGIKSLLMLEDGMIIVSAINADTLNKRNTDTTNGGNQNDR